MLLVTFTVESAPFLSEPVHKSDFSEHVKAMHKERDSGFEREYQVCLYATMDPHMSVMYVCMLQSGVT